MNGVRSEHRQGDSALDGHVPFPDFITSASLVLRDWASPLDFLGAISKVV